MTIKETITVTFTVDEIKELIKDQLLSKGIKATNIRFNVSGHEVDGDWRSEYPLDYMLDDVTCEGVKTK